MTDATVKKLSESLSMLTTLSILSLNFYGYIIANSLFSLRATIMIAGDLAILV